MKITTITIKAPRKLNEIIKDAEKRILKETGIRIKLLVNEGINVDDNVEINPAVQRVATTVANVLDIPVDLLKEETRATPALHARQIAIYLANKYLKCLSPRIIAQAFNRDRTTVIHTRHTVQDMIDTNNEIFLKKLKTAEQAVIDMLNETEDHAPAAGMPM
jgi:chromosomal replication initiation ATPase DnaA